MNLATALILGFLLHVSRASAHPDADGPRSILVLQHAGPPRADDMALMEGHAGPEILRYARPGSTSSFVLTLAGVAGWGAGLTAGYFAGRTLNLDFGDSWVPLNRETVIGAIVGSTLGPPLTVHLANRQRGALLPGILASGTLAMSYRFVEHQPVSSSTYPSHRSSRASRSSD